MKLQKLPSLALALALQLMPICRVAYVSPALAQTGFAVVFRCAAAIGAVLGTVHAVSGASAVISGVVKYPFSPLNPITNNAVGTAGMAFNYRIIVTGGLNDTNADYFNASPLPPGLTINTNVGANAGGTGFITGTGTVAGVYFPVTIYAGNTIYDSLQGSNSAIRTNITITINPGSGGSKPAFTVDPQSRTVTNAGTVSFSATATGSPAPAYQWRKEGTNLTGQTTSTFSIGSATTNDAGNYTVVASNASGSATSHVATLTVLVPASITAQPQDKTVLIGGSALFSVTAAGLPDPVYQWRRNATNLSGATGASYNILSAAPADAAGYTVVVSNSVNSVTSQVARLNLVHAPGFSTYWQTAGQMTLNFTREAGAIYEVLSSSSIPTTNWLTVTNLPAVPATAPVSIQDAATNSPSRFYLIRMTIP